MSEQTNTLIEGSQAQTPELPNLTAYAAAKVANQLFEAAGFEYSIKPQAMYGKRKSIGTDENGALIGANFKKWLDATIEQLKSGNGPVRGERSNYAALAEAFTQNNGHADTHVDENEDQELVDGVTDTEAELNAVEAE